MPLDTKKTAHCAVFIRLLDMNLLCGFSTRRIYNDLHDFAAGSKVTIIPAQEFSLPFFFFIFCTEIKSRGIYEGNSPENFDAFFSEAGKTFHSCYELNVILRFKNCEEQTNINVAKFSADLKISRMSMCSCSPHFARVPWTFALFEFMNFRDWSGLCRMKVLAFRVTRIHDFFRG